MFSTLLPGLRNKEIILGSASPRREEILRKLGLPFRIVTSRFAEDLDKGKFKNRPAEYAVENAFCKATGVCEQLDRESGSKVVIACDTIVYCEGKIYEKPLDAEDAYQMISEYVYSLTVSSVFLLP
ncbi:Maf-like protein [Trichuris suis]|nr:Maf-like protein [Trichuris suis]